MSISHGSWGALRPCTVHFKITLEVDFLCSKIEKFQKNPFGKALISCITLRPKKAPRTTLTRKIHPHCHQEQPPPLEQKRVKKGFLFFEISTSPSRPTPRKTPRGERKRTHPLKRRNTHPAALFVWTLTKRNHSHIWGFRNPIPTHTGTLWNFLFPSLLIPTVVCARESKIETLSLTVCCTCRSPPATNNRSFYYPKERRKYRNSRPFTAAARNRYARTKRRRSSRSRDREQGERDERGGKWESVKVGKWKGEWKREIEREWEREWESERVTAWERERERERVWERESERKWESESETVGERESERVREWEREWESVRERERESVREWEREGEWERVNDWESEKLREWESKRMRDRESETSSELSQNLSFLCFRSVYMLFLGPFGERKLIREIMTSSFGLFAIFIAVFGLWEKLLECQ